MYETTVPPETSSTVINSPLIFVILIVLFNLLLLAGFIFLLVLAIRALMKYLRTRETRPESSEIFQSLGETVKDHRTHCGMTQEFVAENLGVSRQAVSKWEYGTSDPSTSNLIALARLFGVSPAELLKSVTL